MKRIVIYCLLSLLTLNVSFSQNTYPKTLGDTIVIISSEQLKITNQIFLEHKKLLVSDSIYKKQNKSLREALDLSLQLDSINEAKITSYREAIATYEKTQVRLKKKNKIFGFSLLGTVVGIVLLLL